MIKLFKYEFGSTARLLFPLYIVVLGIGFLNKIVTTFGKNTGIEKLFLNDSSLNWRGLDTAVFSFQVFSYFLAALIVAGIFVLTYFSIINRYYNSMYGNEGYLTNTLPLKTHELVLAKFFNFLFWIFIGSVVSLTSIMLLFPAITFDKIWALIVSIISEIDSTSYIDYITRIILISINHFVNSCLTIMIIFLSVTITNFFNNYKLIAGIVSYFVIRTVLNIIYFFLINLPTFLMAINKDPEYLFKVSALNILFAFFLAIIEWIIIFSIINYIHKNKLNLE